MQHELESLGFDTAGSETPVIPMVVGDDRTVFSMVSRLHEDGVFVNPVITPAVPPGRAMIRTSYMATHSRAHLDEALHALKRIGREAGVIH
jgi:7-keto-8-aminopelargonate synthetase-like enzyme